MVDADYIKSILTVDDIISVMSELGADYNFQSSSEIHFRSICHNSNSFKLYYYDNNKSLYCHRCGQRWDIFGIVQKINNIDFPTAIQYVCNICNIKQTYRKDATQIDSWQRDLKKFLPNYEPNEPLKIYDKDILELFNTYYHQTWLDDNISKMAMDKYNIGWYARNAQITIPVYDDNGNLVGIHGRNTRKNIVEKGLKYQPVKTLNEEYKFSTSGVLYGLWQNKDYIQSSQSVIICEAPKSVLLAEDILENNNTVALFGWNMQKRRRDLLLNYGVKNVTIALDRQYHEPSGQEFDIYVKQVKKISNLFKPYCDVYVIWDKLDRLEYKDSPFDKGKEIFNRLYDERIKI